MNNPNDLITQQRAQLAEHIDELTQPRHTAETYTVTELTKKGTRKRVRKRHLTTHPSLLDALYEAMIPATGSIFAGSSGSGGFESESAADPAALAVLDTIRRGAAHWTDTLHIPAPPTELAARLRALAKAPATLTQLEKLTRAAANWTADARLATGYDPPPLTIGQACPNCFHKNTLVITGDLMAARCGHCRTSWDHTTIGLLGRMLTQSQHETTLAARADA